MQVEEAVCAANLHSLSKGCTDIGSTDNSFLSVPPPERDAGRCLETYPYTHTGSERRETEK